MSWKTRMNDQFVHPGLAMHLVLIYQGNAADLSTAWKSWIWAEAVATGNSRTRAGEHYSYTVTMQQLKINPILASRGDLITEKWPRWPVARSSVSDVINDLKIGGVTLTDTSLPGAALTHSSEVPWTMLWPHQDTFGVTENEYWRTEQQF